MWFDSLVFDQQTLRALISAVGANRVVIGSDYPFDMGVTNTVSRLLELTELSEQDKNAISGSNAIELFRLPV
jgi:aminocarboxymuconate-semialdehyde decarboxylase